MASFDEATARRVLLVRACETEAVAPALWSPEDRAWASRLASETAGAAPDAARWLGERARHACERLLPRDRALAAALQRRGWRPGLAASTAGLALLLGLLADGLLGGSRQVDLLALALPAVLAWNLIVYLLLAWHAWRGAGDAGVTFGLRRAMRRLVQGGAGPLPAFAAEWALRAAPLNAARAASLLHLAAAAFAAGLVASLYLRGLVLDFRAGWQSTFLDAEAVHALLALLLAPASVASGIALPDVAGVAALRVGPGQPATASAAPWIHLFATTLGLVVIAPRALLTAWAGVQAWRRARRIEIPLDGPYFQRLLAEAGRAQARLQVLPHGAAPSAQDALALRALLARVFGDGVDLRIAPVTAYGEEERAPPADRGVTLQLACFDLAATPEAEAQGRFVETLAARGTPLVVLADASAWRARFAAMPQRIAEREAAWRRFAEAHGTRLALLDLAAADPDAAARELEAALALPALPTTQAATVSPPSRR